MANDLRLMTEEERRAEGGKEIIDLGKKKQQESVEIQFLVKADEVWYEHVSHIKPFCKICANREFLTEVLEKKRFIRDFQGDELPAERATVKIETRDFTSFGAKSFDLIGERPITEKVMVNGIPIPKKTAKYLEFKCKICKSGSSIQVPIEYQYKKTIKKDDRMSAVGDLEEPGAIKEVVDNSEKKNAPKSSDNGVPPLQIPPSQS